MISFWVLTNPPFYFVLMSCEENTTHILTHLIYIIWFEETIPYITNTNKQIINKAVLLDYTFLRQGTFFCWADTWFPAISIQKENEVQYHWLTRRCSAANMYIINIQETLLLKCYCFISTFSQCIRSILWKKSTEHNFREIPFP